MTPATKFGDDSPIYNWMRNRNTLELIGIWEQIHNPDFKGLEFETFRKQAGLNSFSLTPRKWIDATGAIGFQSRAGRYGGGTYAHKDIAFEFGSWLSPEFKLYLIKEFQRLKDDENDRLKLGWNLHTGTLGRGPSNDASRYHSISLAQSLCLFLHHQYNAGWLRTLKVFRLSNPVWRLRGRTWQASSKRR